MTARIVIITAVAGLMSASVYAANKPVTVELKDAKGGGYRLVKTGMETLSPEAIVDGAIMDASLVVDTVNRVVSSLSVRNNDFGTSLSGHSVIIKKITVPMI